MAYCRRDYYENLGDESKNPTPWRAPEHGSLTRDMKRNWNPEKGPKGHFVIDKRPTILLPERQTFPGWL